MLRDVAVVMADVAAGSGRGHGRAGEREEGTGSVGERILPGMEESCLIDGGRYGTSPPSLVREMR